jgi:hypothetical protein
VLRSEGDGSMKKTILLLIAILMISYLSSTRLVAAEPLRESRSIVVLRMIYENFYAFGGSFQMLRVFMPSDRLEVDDAIDDGRLSGDADDLAGGKTDRIGEGNLDTDVKAVLSESGASLKIKKVRMF